MKNTFDNTSRILQERHAILFRKSAVLTIKIQPIKNILQKR